LIFDWIMHSLYANFIEVPTPNRSSSSILEIHKYYEHTISRTEPSFSMTTSPLNFPPWTINDMIGPGNICKHDVLQTDCITIVSVIQTMQVHLTTHTNSHQARWLAPFPCCNTTLI
jgi:hypothetical protein